jgi:hypothetical protein
MGSSGPGRVRVERGIYRQPNGKYAVCWRHAGRLRFRTVGIDIKEARRARLALIAATREGSVPGLAAAVLRDGRELVARALEASATQARSRRTNTSSTASCYPPWSSLHRRLSGRSGFSDDEPLHRSA